jgi:hypothetical protein
VVFGQTVKKSRAFQSILGWLTLGVLLLGTVGCTYQRHWNMGPTEKWVASDVHIVPKAVGLIFLPLFDSLSSPVTGGVDMFTPKGEFDKGRKYLSYAGSRTIGESDMGLGYQIWCSIFTIPIETLFLPITGLFDLIYVLSTGDDGTTESDEF